MAAVCEHDLQPDANGPALTDLHRVANEARTAEEKKILADVLDLAGKCAAEEHLYLKFVGD